jgi:S1-C subfamily serine protease
MSCRQVALRTVVLVLAVAATPWPATAQDLGAAERQQLFYTTKPAVAWVLATAHAQIQIPTDRGVMSMESMNGNTGSAWVITSDGYVVTNGHVVELFHARNEDRLKMMLFFQALERDYFPAVARQRRRQLTQDEKFQIFQQLYPQAQIVLKKDLTVFLQNWRRYPGEVKQYSAPIFEAPGKISFPWQDIETGKDVAILKIEGRDLPTVPLGNSDAVQIGDEVFVAGYPGVVFQHEYLSPETALEASFTRGQISSVKLDVKGTSVLQMDAATTWGNSGGPVFNARGEVVGMATFGSIAEMGPMSQAIQGFNFAVPANTVREFIRAAGAVPEPSIFDRTWQRALSDYYGRRYSRAIVGFDEALRLMPDLPDALKLRREAMLALQTTPPGTPPWLRYVIAAAIVLGLALLIGGLVLRRRSGERVAPTSRPAAGHLVVREGPLQGNQFPVTPQGVRIGRDAASCQVVLSEVTVSREHALIAPDGSRIRIRNLSGTNPTYLNDRAIQEAELKEGDSIKIGESVITFHTN